MAREVKLVRYRYDDRGDMVETLDALDVSKHFVYSGGHLLVRLTNQGVCPSIGNMKVRGECPLCAYMGRWRRDGIFHPLRQGISHIRNGENAETEYYYGEGQTHLQDSGCQQRSYPSPIQQLSGAGGHGVNPEGYTRKTAYNEFGQPVG
ncbi:hypothetical protein NXW50_13710 [Bacteroides thetaiotaomicron]|nr:hypothetical protein [Bacteroides thetaiotaomicron]MCS2279205.1 hypothetical protein [Bacteroides thetaiotaomicron]